MLSRRLFVLMPILTIILAGCYRQASDPVEAPQVDSVANTQVVATTAFDNASATPQATADSQSPIQGVTSTPIQLATNTSIPTVIPTNTSLPTVIAATNTTMPTLPPAMSSTPIPTDSGATAPIQAVTSTPIPTNTPAILTPGLPGGNTAITTPTPLPQQPTATPSGLVTPTQFPLPTQADDTVNPECIYIVRAGDTVFRIAINNGTTVNAIVAANPGLNPNLIRPGDEIKLPDCEPAPTDSDTDTGSSAEPIDTDSDADEGIVGATETVHIVRAGETLSSIAQRYGVTVLAIMQRNGLTDPNRLSVNQELII
ncbi:MAG: hypothetical protein CUN56_04945, partial [Phototrophicales bacterium]